MDDATRRVVVRLLVLAAVLVADLAALVTCVFLDGPDAVTAALAAPLAVLVPALADAQAEHRTRSLRPPPLPPPRRLD